MFREVVQVHGLIIFRDEALDVKVLICPIKGYVAICYMQEWTAEHIHLKSCIFKIKNMTVTSVSSLEKSTILQTQCKAILQHTLL